MAKEADGAGATSDKNDRLWEDSPAEATTPEKAADEERQEGDEGDGAEDEEEWDEEDEGDEEEWEDEEEDEEPPDMAARILCPDGACIGVIGPDGRCKECGTEMDPADRSRLDPGSQAADDADDDAAEDDAPDPDPWPQEEDDGEPPDLGSRELCPDGCCIGVIGPDGRCKECGKPRDWTEEDEAAEQAAAEAEAKDGEDAAADDAESESR